MTAVLSGALQQSQPSAAENAITRQMANYLRSVPDRNGGGGRQKPPVNEDTTE